MARFRLCCGMFSFACYGVVSRPCHRTTEGLLFVTARTQRDFVSRPCLLLWHVSRPCHRIDRRSPLRYGPNPTRLRFVCDLSFAVMAWLRRCHRIDRRSPLRYGPNPTRLRFAPIGQKGDLRVGRVSWSGDHATTRVGPRTRLRFAGQLVKKETFGRPSVVVGRPCHNAGDHAISHRPKVSSSIRPEPQRDFVSRQSVKKGDLRSAEWPSCISARLEARVVACRVIVGSAYVIRCQITEIHS